LRGHARGHALRRRVKAMREGGRVEGALQEGGGGGDVVSCARRGRNGGAATSCCVQAASRGKACGVLSCPKGVKGGAAASFLHIPGQAAIGGTVKGIKKGVR
jgi:hypothetical protein